MTMYIKRISAAVVAFLLVFSMGILVNAADSDNDQSSQIVAAQMETVAKQKGKDAAAALIDESINDLSVSGTTLTVRNDEPLKAKSYSAAPEAPAFSVSVPAVLGFIAIFAVLLLGIYICYKNSRRKAKNYSPGKNIIFGKSK